MNKNVTSNFRITGSPYKHILLSTISHNILDFNWFFVFVQICMVNYIPIMIFLCQWSYAPPKIKYCNHDAMLIGINLYVHSFIIMNLVKNINRTLAKKNYRENAHLLKDYMNPSK